MCQSHGCEAVETLDAVVEFWFSIRAKLKDLRVGDAVLLALHLQPRVVQLTLYLALLGGLRRSKQSVSFHFIAFQKSIVDFRVR